MKIGALHWATQVKKEKYGATLVCGEFCITSYCSFKLLQGALGLK